MPQNISRTISALLLMTAIGAHSQSFPSTANPKIVTASVPGSSFANMGLAFLSDGRMIVLTASIQSSGQAMGQGAITPADGNQAVYVVSGLSRSGSLSGATFTKILDSLTGAAPGVVVVNDTVYVMDRTAFYRINSLNPTGGTAKSKNATRLINVPTLDSTFSWNRGPSGHQWIFTPQYHNGRFYGAYSGSIITGGTSNAAPTSTYSGALLSWSKDAVVPETPVNSGYLKEAGGLRSPNGLGTNGAYMLYTDNQGSFNPGNPIHIFKPGQALVTYGTRQATTANAGGATGITNTLRNWAEDLPYRPPVIWVPFDGPSRSLTQPLYLSSGPYKGDWIVGDANASGMGRLHVEEVDNTGHYQASFHLFSGSSLNTASGNGTQAFNRLAMSPDSAIYLGAMLRIGNWPSGAAGPIVRVTFRDTAIFEILAVRSRKSAAGDANGVEVFFSQPVNPATAIPANFTLLQNNYRLGGNYGCNTTLCTTRTPTVTAVTLSNDNRKAFLAIATPDTSIGAAHIGTIGVGNNGTGVWGGPGAQDRTLRVTASGVTSASGASLFYNNAWLGWHFQAEKRFDPANTDVTPTPIQARPVDRLAAAVTVRPLAGVLNVDVGLPGPATVSLYGVNGALKAQQAGAGAFRFDTRAFGRGLHIVRVAHGKTVYSRALML